MRPCATITIPVFNQRHDLLLKAVESACAQTVPVDVVIVDDGSDWPVSEIPDLPSGVRVIRHDNNRGIAAALNTGIESGLRASDTSCDFWCWLSSDDTIARKKIETQRNDMQRWSCLLGFHGYRVEVEPGFKPILGQFAAGDIVLAKMWSSHDEQRRLFSQGCYINGSTVMIHKSVFDEVGLFDPEFRYSQDWEFWCRSGTRYQWHYLPRVLGTRLEHRNLTARKATDDEMRMAAWREDNEVRRRYADTV